MSDNSTKGDAAARRTGEEVGWIGGWLGGFLWLLILSVVWLVQGHMTAGTVSLALFLIAVGAILLLAPWRHPSTRQWKLMLPLYLVLFASIAWAVWTWGGLAQSGLSWWSFFWILPCLIPFWTVGGKRWNDWIDVHIRRATPEDASALARVHVDSWREGYRGIVPDVHLQGFTVEHRTERFRQSLEADSEETYLAEREGRIVGFLTIGACRDEDVDRATTGEIWGIYLAPSYWRKGIGRFLCGQGEKMLASRGFSVATLWVLEENSQARRFYETMGFAQDGATKEVDLGVKLIAVRYRKGLDTAAFVSRDGQRLC